MYASNPITTWKMEAGKAQVQNQQGLHSEFKASLKCIVKSCPKEKNRKTGDGVDGWVED